jgi:hypothetical protein
VLKHPAALGFRVHSGWAAMVALSGPVTAPLLVLRRRIELCVGVSKQPYHEAEKMTLSDATVHIEKCAISTNATSRNSLCDAIAKLSAYDLKGGCILAASGRPLPDLAAILRSHALIHTAEGEFFRSAVRAACDSRGLVHLQVKERDLWAEAARVLGRSREELQSTVEAFKKDLGPPWQQDQKLAALAAWVMLAR